MDLAPIGCPPAQAALKSGASGSHFVLNPWGQAMLLTEITTVPPTALPLQQLKDHLRLGQGFSPGLDPGSDPGSDQASAQDALLISYLRAALAAIEGRIGRALLRRNYCLEVTRWSKAASQPLPLAPVTEVLSVKTLTPTGEETLIAPSRWVFVPDGQRPVVQGRGGNLPFLVGEGLIARITFTAGFGATWADIPADLAQAVLLLAGEFYDYRHNDYGPGPGLPRQVAQLIETWRPVRVLGGGQDESAAVEPLSVPRGPPRSKRRRWRL